MRQTESREQRRSQTNQNKALKDAKSLQSGGVDWIDSLWFPWWKECPSPSGVDEQLSGVQLSWRLQLFEKLTRICQINIKMTKMVPREHKVAAVVLSDKYSFALRQTWGKPNPRPTLSRTSGNVPLVLLEERVSVRSYRSDDLNHNMKPDAENSRRIDRGENIRNRVFIATQLISVWGFSFQTKSSEDLCSHLLTAEPLMIRSKLPLSANTLGTRAHPCFHLCVRALQTPLRRTYCTSHSMKTQTNCFTDTANVHALKVTPDWRSDIFWSCVPNSCWSDYIAFQMRYMSPHAAVPGHFMNTNVTLAFEESTNHVHTNRDTYLSISVYIQLKGKHRVCFECELLPGSEDAAQENAPCSRSPGPGEPGSQPSSGPCLSRTPYTRLCCPWFNLYKCLSSECKGL